MTADLHTQLVTEVQRRLDVARTAAAQWAAIGVLVSYRPEEPVPFVAADALTDHIALQVPDDAIRRYEADLRRLDRHRPSALGCFCADETCQAAAGDGRFVDWPCEEVLDLAASLGVEVPA